MTHVLDRLGRAIRSPAFTFVLIAFLILLLGIPLLIVSLFVGEREARARGVWGGAQQVVGPLLVAPDMVAAFAVLYFILRLEDYALLAGALMGFATLTLVMFATLRVDWSGDRSDPV